MKPPFTAIDSSSNFQEASPLLELRKHARLDIVDQSLRASLELLTDERRILDELDIVSDALLEPVMLVRSLRVTMALPTRCIETYLIPSPN